jgi:HEAT repeat protein
VTSTRRAGGNNRLDVGLEINRTPVERRTLPTIRAKRLLVSDNPEADNSLHVRQTKDRMVKQLQESYDRKSVKALLADLEDPVAFVRHLAENALVTKGLEGLTPALARAKHANWRVRSAVCNLVDKAWGKYKEDPKGKQMALLKAQIPALTRLLSDDHFWVRTRAAGALARFGESAKSALPGLLKNVRDSDEWVRVAAIRAIGAVSRDPGTAVEAAALALAKPSSSYASLRNSLSLFRKHPNTEQARRLEALLQLLRHPPEGGGGRLLNEAMGMVVALDPEGTSVVPVLIEAAADKTHLSRQRANPRGKAIETLGNYGDKAVAALPTLRAILASETKADKAQHEAVRKAIAAIEGKPQDDSSR